MKATARKKPAKDTPFERFDRLFCAVISVPKNAIEKEEAKLKKRKKRVKK
jgi:hypothetical protein